MTVAAFDEVARVYDSSFTVTPLGMELRRIVQRSLAEAFRPGERVLELNCGTGEDAVWLARRGVRVLATDNSPAMLETAARKAELNGLSTGIQFHPFDLDCPSMCWPDSEFDGAFSNFGGLNCVRDLAPLAAVLGRSIKPAGRLILVVMGRLCVWEILWYLLHLKPRIAFRRLSETEVGVQIAGRSIRVWYPSQGNLELAFTQQFRLMRVCGIGVFLPPTYLQQVVTRRMAVFRMLCRLERSVGSKTPLRHFADHILLIFERRPLTPESDR